MKKLIITIIFLMFAANAFSQLRAFNQIFPNAGEDITTNVFKEDGYVKSSQSANGFVILGNEQSALNQQNINMVLRNNPGYLVESILVIPGNPDSVTLLDIYNALGKVQLLKGRLYRSHTRSQDVPLFEEATRIASDKKTTSIPDPAPSVKLPGNETVYIRLRDANFGNTFYRAEMLVVQNGIRYTLSNFRSMNYLFVPVIKEEKFTAQLYIEPIKEGVLIYSVAGADISDFIASKIHIESAISKRLAIITGWAADGLKKIRP